jgi:ribosome-associated translation inhibitor RaiA
MIRRKLKLQSMITLAMKLTRQHLRVRSSEELDALIQNRILALQPSLDTGEAEVRLECRFERSPAYKVGIRLVAPGPDLSVEADDHTLYAAFRKVMRQLNYEIGSRHHKRLRRARSNRSARPAKSRAARALRTLNHSQL